MGPPFVLSSGLSPFLGSVLVGDYIFIPIAVLVVAGLSAFGNLPRIEDPRMTLRNGVIVTALPGARRIAERLYQPYELR